MPEPDDFSAALTTFCQMSPQTREQVVAAFERIEPAISVKELAKVAAAETGQDLKLLVSLANGIAPLVRLVIDDEHMLNLFVGFFTNRITIKQAQDPTVEDHLGRLLRCEHSIGLTGKAQTILWGHGKIYRDAHVLTQIRPVFFKDISVEPGAAVIVHELKINAFEDKEEQSVCLAMDRPQLLALRAVLNRAIEKESTLRKGGKFQFLQSISDNSEDDS